MIYWLLPRLFQTKLWSQKLANAHFWLGTVGILLYIIPIYVAGITQGLMWRAMTDTGPAPISRFRRDRSCHHSDVLAPRSRRVSSTSPARCWAASTSTRPGRARPRVYEEPIQRAPALSSALWRRCHRPRLEPGQRRRLRQDDLDVWSTFWWHRRWERLPLQVHDAGRSLAVVAASLFEIVPSS